jgi:hypothetical protein
MRLVRSSGARPVSGIDCFAEARPRLGGHGPRRLTAATRPSALPGCRRWYGVHLEVNAARPEPAATARARREQDPGPVSGAVLCSPCGTLPPWLHRSSRRRRGFVRLRPPMPASVTSSAPRPRHCWSATALAKAASRSGSRSCWLLSVWTRARRMPRRRSSLAAADRMPGRADRRGMAGTASCELALARSYGGSPVPVTDTDGAPTAHWSARLRRGYPEGRASVAVGERCPSAGSYSSSAGGSTAQFGLPSC